MPRIVAQLRAGGGSCPFRRCSFGRSGADGVAHGPECVHEYRELVGRNGVHQPSLDDIEQRRHVGAQSLIAGFGQPDEAEPPATDAG